MSVDVSAALVYGYRIEASAMTERFRELRDDDFQELDGKYVETLGEEYVYNLVCQDDDYREDSDWHIAVEVPTKVRIDPDDPFSRYRNVTAEELSAAAKMVGEKDVVDALKQLYEDVMGEPPVGEPFIDLYVNWW